ncbi:g2339 [Coccomyxa viridis]|uniref:Ubiquitin carboxyl-terminal hydrolase n=1 Tax=Coccomyxa viridis TaxID=1274662 RepID=A0ABP1FK57_9CHLO
MAEGDSWTTIESDPGVFTELITEMGVQGVQVEELWSLDKESLEALRPVYGLIFLFKWQSEKDDRVPLEHGDYHGKVFFAKQVINNACATQAILSVLLNKPELKLGSELTSLRDFTTDFSSEMRGLAIGNSESIRQVHNSFHPPQPIVPEESRIAEKDDEVYHFISYLPIDGHLYELDGLKPGPVRLCEATEEDWLEKAGAIIQSRIERYAQSEIRFNLMSVIRDRRAVYEEQLASLQARRASSGDAGTRGETSMVIDSGGGKAQTGHSDSVESDILRIQEALHQEKAKFKRWHSENVRRKTNYVPFIFNFLKVLAEQDQLTGLIDRANKLQAAKE